MSLGGKNTSTTQIDPELKAAALEQLAMAKEIGQLGFVPYKGATVAGLQPAQIAAMQNTNAGLEAFGLSGSPVPVAGDLSPYGIYQEQLAQMAPGQRAFIDSMFINPITGAAPASVAAAQAEANAAATAAQRSGKSAVEYGRGGNYSPAATGSNTRSFDTIGAYLPGGIFTHNPGSLANRAVAALSAPQGKPTAKDRPVSRSTASGSKKGTVK